MGHLQKVYMIFADRLQSECDFNRWTQHIG
jgi:hypothetical protein